MSDMVDNIDLIIDNRKRVKLIVYIILQLLQSFSGILSFYFILESSKG